MLNLFRLWPLVGKDCTLLLPIISAGIGIERVKPELAVSDLPDLVPNA